jgi:hypothetical protein
MSKARDVIELLEGKFLTQLKATPKFAPSPLPKKKKSRAILKKAEKTDAEQEAAFMKFLFTDEADRVDLFHYGRAFQNNKFSIIGNSIKDAKWLYKNLRPWLVKNNITHKIGTYWRVNINPNTKYNYGQSKKLTTIYIPKDTTIEELGKQLKKVLKNYRGYKGVKGLPFWGYTKFAPGIYYRRDRDEHGKYINPKDHMNESVARKMIGFLESYKVCLCPRKTKVCTCPGGKEQVRKRGRRRWAEPYSPAQDYTMKGDYVMVEGNPDESLGTASDIGAAPTLAFDVIDGRRPRMRMFNIVYFARGEKGKTTVRGFTKEDAMKKASANLLRKLKGGFKILKVY